MQLQRVARTASGRIMSTAELSKGALISIMHIRGKLKQRVYNALRVAGWDGMTCDEMERMLDLKHQTLSARVRELWQEGFLKKAGERRTRSGRWATVYRARKRRKPRKKRDRCPHCGQVMVKR